MRRRSQTIVFALASLLGVAACTGVPETDIPDAPVPFVTADVEEPPPPGSPETAPPDNVPTPEPLPLPEYPEDLTAEDTAENAVRAAEYFLDLMNYIQSTGHVEPFEEVAADSCASCDRFIERINDLYQGGGFSTGNYIQMAEPLAERTEDGFAWVVVSDWIVSDGLRHSPNPEKVVELEGATLEQHRVGAQLIEGSWRILAFARALDE